jgi:hypothetical protein
MKHQFGGAVTNSDKGEREETVRRQASRAPTGGFPASTHLDLGPSPALHWGGTV